MRACRERGGGPSHSGASYTRTIRRPWFWKTDRLWLSARRTAPRGLSTGHRKPANSGDHFVKLGRPLITPSAFSWRQD